MGSGFTGVGFQSPRTEGFGPLGSQHSGFGPIGSRSHDLGPTGHRDDTPASPEQPSPTPDQRHEQPSWYDDGDDPFTATDPTPATPPSHHDDRHGKEGWDDGARFTADVDQAHADDVAAARDQARTTAGGLSLFDDSDRTSNFDRSSASQVPPDPHRFTVDIHGDADRARVGRTLLNPHELADIIRSDPRYQDGQPVRLLMCDAGRHDDGFAAKLAKELKAPVLAARSDVWVTSNGDVFASRAEHDGSGPKRPGWPPNGEWATFHPDGRVETHGSGDHDRPYPPGHKPDWAATAKDWDGPPALLSRRGTDAPPWPGQDGFPRDPYGRSPTPPPVFGGHPSGGPPPPGAQFGTNTWNQSGPSPHGPHPTHSDPRAGQYPPVRQPGAPYQGAPYQGGPYQGGWQDTSQVDRRHPPAPGVQPGPPVWGGQPATRPNYPNTPVPPGGPVPPGQQVQPPRQGYPPANVPPAYPLQQPRSGYTGARADASPTQPGAGRPPATNPWPPRNPGQPQGMRNQGGQPFGNQPYDGGAQGGHHLGNHPQGGSRPGYRGGPNHGDPYPRGAQGHGNQPPTARPAPPATNPVPAAPRPLQPGAERYHATGPQQPAPKPQHLDTAPHQGGGHPGAAEPGSRNDGVVNASSPTVGSPDELSGAAHPGAAPETPKPPRELTHSEIACNPRADLAIDAYAHEHGMTREEVWNKIQIGRLGITEDLRIFEKRRQTPAEALERPDDLSVEYLNQVIQHRRANERRGVEDYESQKLPPFEAGCPDNELPSHMRRRMPRDAVADTLDRVNPDDVHLIYPGDGGGMWRDLSEGDAFLRPENAIFRLDSRGAELLQAGGFRVRDPGNLNINAHVGSAHNGGGFTSFSMSPEHAIQRDEAVSPSMNDVERLPSGFYRQVRYMHEAYHPYGVLTDASFHDRGQSSGHKEAEVLLPGGLPQHYVYRMWPREIIFDVYGNILTTVVYPPIYNPNFKYRRHPLFARKDR